MPHCLLSNDWVGGHLVNFIRTVLGAGCFGGPWGRGQIIWMLRHHLRYLLYVGFFIRRAGYVFVLHIANN